MKKFELELADWMIVYADVSEVDASTSTDRGTIKGTELEIENIEIQVIDRLGTDFWFKPRDKDEAESLKEKIREKYWAEQEEVA